MSISAALPPRLSNEQIVASLRRGTLRCGTELFAAYGVALKPTPVQAVPDLAFMTIAGFAGGQVAGYVALGADLGVLRRTNATPSTPNDWIAELGNQFLGRIKNFLLREGLAICRVPPAVIRGGGPAVLDARAGTEVLRLADQQDAVWIWMSCETSSVSDLLPEMPPDSDVLAEGEMLLF